jgi:hypothetical protein
MFSLFGKSGKAVYTDKVWQTQKACVKGLVAEATIAIKASKIPVVLFYFEDSRKKFLDYLAVNNVLHGEIGSGNGVEAAAPGVILVADAFGIASNDVANWFGKQAANSSLAVFFFGHYPLMPPEDQFLEKLKQRIGDLPIAFCLSLEDGLLLQFRSERIKSTMAALGMGDDECIEHPMVSKAIQSARKKLGERVSQEIKSKSESEWFSINVK